MRLEVCVVVLPHGEVLVTLFLSVLEFVQNEVDLGPVLARLETAVKKGLTAIAT